MFQPIPTGSEKKHPSEHFIAPLVTTRQSKTNLEVYVKDEALKQIIQTKYQSPLSNSDIEKLWKELHRQASLTPDSNGRITYNDYIEVKRNVPGPVGDYFSPSIFLGLEKDDQGRISIISFFQYCLRKEFYLKTRINLTLQHSNGDEYVTESDLDAFIKEMLPRFPHLKNLDETEHQYYCCHATRKFFFFLDPMNHGRIYIKSLITSPILSELMMMKEDDLTEDQLLMNWFSLDIYRRVYENYINTDNDQDGLLSEQELYHYGYGSFTKIFINRILDEFNTFEKKLDFKSYLNFILMIRYKKTKESLTLYFRLFDYNQRGYITVNEVNAFVHEMVNHLKDINIMMEFDPEDVKNEIFDLVRPKVPDRITLDDLIACGCGDLIVGMMTDSNRFYNYDQREYDHSKKDEVIDDIIPDPPRYDGYENDDDF